MNKRPDAQTLKAKRAEIRRRYARGRPKFSWVKRRVRDLEKTYGYYFGRPLPDDDNSRDLALIMCHHLAGAYDDPRHSIPQWLEAWAPWLSIVDARTMVADAIAKPRRWKADTLAWRLKLDDATRTRLGITTIGSVDVSREERAARREQRKYRRLLDRRRHSGIKPRAQYEAQAVSNAKPWLELGISRRTWYRRRGTGLHPSI